MPFERNNDHLQLTEKFKIYPNKQQEELLLILSEQCRKAYNVTLERVKKNVSDNVSEILSEKKKEWQDFKYYNVVKELRLNNEWCDWVRPDVLHQCISEIKSQYMSYWTKLTNWNNDPRFDVISGKPRGKPRPPSFKSRNYFTTMTFRDHSKDLKVMDGNRKFVLQHYHPSKVRLSFEIPNSCKCLNRKKNNDSKLSIDDIKIKQLKIVQETKMSIDYLPMQIKSNEPNLQFVSMLVSRLSVLKERKVKPLRWYVCITYDVIKEVPFIDNGLYIGMDLGTNPYLFVTCNLQRKSICFNNKDTKKKKEKYGRHPYTSIMKYWEPQIQELQHIKDYHCTKYSNRYNRMNDRIIKIKKKRSRQLNSLQHQLTNKFLKNTKANVIIVEKHNIQEMVKRKKGTGDGRKTKSDKSKNRNTQGYALARFVQFLTYKARLLGKKIIEIDPIKFSPSQTCCVCGNKKTGKNKLTTETREYICGKCRNEMDRDLNASTNILKIFVTHKNSYENFISMFRFPKAPKVGYKNYEHRKKKYEIALQKKKDELRFLYDSLSRKPSVAEEHFLNSLSLEKSLN